MFFFDLERRMYRDGRDQRHSERVQRTSAWPLERYMVAQKNCELR